VPLSSEFNVVYTRLQVLGHVYQGTKIGLTGIWEQLMGSVKESNMFHNYETEKITRKASDSRLSWLNCQLSKAH